MAASTTCFVADEAQYDVWESDLHGGQGGLAGVDAGHVPEKDPHAYPSLLGFSVLSNVAVSCRSVVCLAGVYDSTSMSSGPRSMLKATVNVVASFALPCS